jgi:ABC-type transport system substrate-binding protein
MFLKKSAFVTFVVVTILSLALSACGGGTTKKPVTLRIGWAGSPDTLNPGTAVLAEAWVMFELTYNSMYELQLDGSYTLECHYLG